jgi:hypothetical protein
MSLMFYPQLDDIEGEGALEQRIETLMEAAERYKAMMMDASRAEIKATMPRELTGAFNWEEIARVLRQARDLSEASKPEKTRKANVLTKLSEVYEVLRAAKMPKLEAVRIALMSEVGHLRS